MLKQGTVDGGSGTGTGSWLLVGSGNTLRVPTQPTTPRVIPPGTCLSHGVWASIVVTAETAIRWSLLSSLFNSPQDVNILQRLRDSLDEKSTTDESFMNRDTIVDTIW